MDVIIDTDPGGDDAIALMWLASLMHQKRINLLAVTTAAGNVGPETTFRNAAGILAMCGLGAVPVGMAPPAGAARNAAEVHGEDGIGGLAGALPKPAETNGTVPGSIDLLATFLTCTGVAPYVLAVAPLTNFARAESSAPGTLRRARDLIVMGGSLGRGNITRSAEFNFYFDPDSAAAVLAARDETRIVTLDTSRSLRLTEPLTSRILRGFEKVPLAKFFAHLCNFMSERDARLAGRRSTHGFPVHDAAVVAWLAYPELFKSRRCRLAVETGDGERRGRLGESDGPRSAACEVVTGIARDALLQRMSDDLRDLFSRL